jgi:hypothetical protein
MGHKLENWLGDEKMIVIRKGCAGSICWVSIMDED